MLTDSKRKVAAGHIPLSSKGYLDSLMGTFQLCFDLHGHFPCYWTTGHALKKAENELETQVGIKGSASGGVGHKKPHHAICKPLSRKHCDYAQPRLSQYRKKPWRLYGSGLSCSSGHSLCPTFGKSLQDLCLSGPLMNMPSLMYHLVLVRRCVQLLLFELRVTKHWLDRLLHGLTLPLSFFAKQRITMAKTKP